MSRASAADVIFAGCAERSGGTAAALAAGWCVMKLNRPRRTACVLRAAFNRLFALPGAFVIDRSVGAERVIVTVRRRWRVPAVQQTGRRGADRLGFAATTSGPAITDGDVAILQFLAAAELIETDLWVQYAELAVNNAPYGAALSVLENEIVIYTSDVASDEQSHADFITFLVANGKSPTGACQVQ